MVIETLGPGGAERVLALVADGLAARGHEVRLVTFAAPSTDFFRVGADVSRIGLDPRRGVLLGMGIVRNLVRIVRLRRVLAAVSPDVVLSFMETTNVVVLAASLGACWPVVVAERTDPRRWNVAPFWAHLRRLLYPRAAGVVVQTVGVAAWAEAIVPRSRVHIVPNPVAAPVDAKRRDRWPLVLGVGRLGNEKGFDVLLTAFARSGIAAAGWRLIVVGDGVERETLLALACELGVADAVELPGLLDRDPLGALYAECGVFVLPSRLEGFPNALLEAMAYGAPVVASDCDSGPREIVTDGVDGWLVPPGDAEALAERLRVLAADPGLRARVGAAARSVVERYAVDGVVAEWERILAGAGQATDHRC